MVPRSPALLAGLLLAGCWVPRAEAPPPVTPLPSVPPGPPPPAVTVVAARVGPFAPGQVWSGTYVCAQGPTELAVEITGVQGRSVQATFAFRHPPSGAAGRYQLLGVTDPATSTVELTPGEWFDRPLGYVSVGMRGQVAPDGRSWTGRITHASCGEFALRLATP